MDDATTARIKRYYEVFNERGELDEDEFFAPDVEWVNAAELPGATVYRGRGRVLADIAAQGEAFEWRQVEPVEIQDAGNKLVVSVKFTAQGKASGAPVEIDLVHVWTVDAGRVCRIEAFVDREAALRSAGVE
jgi:ketosteroid isomerase-like protein